jgi:UDP-glucose 4-epimerase
MHHSFKDNKVLVTGGAGFIGSHLVEALVAAGAAVTILDDFSTGYRSNLEAVWSKLHIERHDLARDDLAGVFSGQGYRYAFHLAANGYVPPSIENPRLDFEKNALGTFNLLEALRAHSPDTRLVYTSTAAVYGDGVPHAISESHPVDPMAPYGVSKLAGERYLSVYARTFGLAAASVRLFSVFGPRLRKQVVYDFIRKLQDNPDELYIYGDGSQIRDLNHVSNVVDAMLLVAAAGELTGEVYNVASGESLSIRELAEMLSRLMGLAPTFVFSGQVRQGDAQNWTADFSRLSALGYRPKTAVEPGLQALIAWCAEHR